MAEKEKEEPKKEKKESLKLSEFIANQDINLHYKEDKPCSNIEEGCKNVKLKPKDKIPEIFIPNFLEHNRNFLSNLPRKDGLPYLTPEQEEKYGVQFRESKSKPIRRGGKYSAENLMRKWTKLGDDKFKEWAEKEFGADEIDKRMSPRNIISEIRKIVG